MKNGPCGRVTHIEHPALTRGELTEGEELKQYREPILQGILHRIHGEGLVADGGEEDAPAKHRLDGAAVATGRDDLELSPHRVELATIESMCQFNVQVAYRLTVDVVDDVGLYHVTRHIGNEQRLDVKVVFVVVVVVVVVLWMA